MKQVQTEDEKQDTKLKTARRIRYMLTALLAGLTVFNAVDKYTDTYSYKKLVISKGKSIFYNKPITKDEIINCIKTSNLTEEEKNYLENTEFFDFYEKLAKKYNYDCDLVYDSLEGLTIEEMPEKDKEERQKTLGFVKPTEPKIIYIRDYNKQDIRLVLKVLAHEYIHKFSDPLNINSCFLGEALTEILRTEFYGGGRAIGYQVEVIITKMLMETIGAEPVAALGLFNEEGPLREELGKYLNKEETDLLIEGLMSEELFKNDGPMNNKRMLDRISDLFERKYGYDVALDQIMMLISHSETKVVLNRNYFKESSESSYDVLEPLEDAQQMIVGDEFGYLKLPGNDEAHTLGRFNNEKAN